MRGAFSYLDAQEEDGPENCFAKLMTHTTRMPSQFDELPEPARIKAFETFQALLADGIDEQEALEQASQQAQNWITERGPTAQV